MSGSSWRVGMPTERRPLTRPQAVRKIAPTATMIGQTLGHYRIDERIGAGGMGEVYKATDTRLDRTVAIKLVPKPRKRTL